MLSWPTLNWPSDGRQSSAGSTELQGTLTAQFKNDGRNWHAKKKWNGAEALRLTLSWPALSWPSNGRLSPTGNAEPSAERTACLLGAEFGWGKLERKKSRWAV